MNKLVALQHVTRAVTPDGYVDTWATYAQVRAAVEPSVPSTFEALTSSTITTPVSHTVTLPYVAGVLGADRVLWKGRALYIARIQNPGEDNRELVLGCEERGA